MNEVHGHESLNLGRKINKMRRAGSKAKTETLALLSLEKGDMERVTGGNVIETRTSVSFTKEDMDIAAKKMGVDERDTLKLHQQPTSLLRSETDINTWTEEYKRTGKNQFPIIIDHPYEDSTLQAYFDHTGALLTQIVKGERVQISLIDDQSITHPFTTIDTLDELINTKEMIQNKFVKDLMRDVNKEIEGKEQDEMIKDLMKETYNQTV